MSGRRAHPPGGFDYDVSEEQLEAFSRLTLLQRLEWLEQARLFTLLARTPQTAERQERLRLGKSIDETPEPPS